jgi:hypothetical protein
MSTIHIGIPSTVSHIHLHVDNTPTQELPAVDPEVPSCVKAELYTRQDIRRACLEILLGSEHVRTGQGDWLTTRILGVLFHEKGPL